MHSTIFVFVECQKNMIFLLWSECCIPQNSYVESLPPKVMVFGRWVWGGNQVMRVDLMNELRTFIK